MIARILLGAAVLLVFARLRRVKLPPFGVLWAHVTVTEVFGMAAPFLLLAWGERSTSAAMAGVLVGATPLLTLAAATTILHSERTTWQRTACLVAGFAGVIVVISPWQSNPGSLAGQLACLGSAACYAIQTAYTRRFLSGKGVPPLALATSQLITASVLQAIVTPLLGWQAPSFNWPVVSSILVLGTVNTGIAYVLYFRLIGDIGATTAAAVNYFVPILAVLIGVVVLGEAVTWNMVVGALIVLMAFALAERRVRLGTAASAVSGS